MTFTTSTAGYAGRFVVWATVRGEYANPDLGSCYLEGPLDAPDVMPAGSMKRGWIAAPIQSVCERN